MLSYQGKTSAKRAPMPTPNKKSILTSSTTFALSIHQLHPGASKMAGGKKKKKPAANPARGVATTSIASKPKVEAPEVEPKAANGAQDSPEVGHNGTAAAPTGAGSGPPGQPQQEMSPEEFERHLETSELQALVEKHAQKSKRDALRQKSRLETDRRVLRNQAESLNTRKWLPPELMEEILDLLKAEGRFTAQGGEVPGNLKPASEEDLTIRLWTLQQSLIGAGFAQDKVAMALKFVLDISEKINIGSKDAIWGMEEALEWLARECSREELPDYESWQRKPGIASKSQAGSFYLEYLLCLYNLLITLPNSNTT